jgi:hypothetical protein
MGLMWSLFLIGHLYFEWYMVRLTVLKGHHRGTCHNAIGLCAQHKDTILGSIVTTIGRAYVSLKRGLLLTFASQLRF